MWGILAVCQVLAVGAQGVILWFFPGDPQGHLATTCSLVGLGGLQRAAVDKDEEERAKEASQFFRAIGVGLPETLPGLLLQPSLFALTFADTDTAGQYKQLLSLVVSWAMALKAAVELALSFVKIRKERPPREEMRSGEEDSPDGEEDSPEGLKELRSGEQDSPEGEELLRSGEEDSLGGLKNLCLALFIGTIVLGLSTVFVVGVLVTIGVGMLRVFFAYLCEDHVWNLFTGCVEL